MSVKQGWTPPALIREAYRNTVSGRWFSVAIVLIIMGATVSATMVDAANVSDIHAAEQRFLADGGNIVQIAGTEGEAKVNAAACSALSHSPDVIASSAVSSRVDGARLAGRPEAMQTIHYATAGFEKIAGSSVTLDAGQALSAASIAERWRYSTGALIGFEPAQGLDPSVEVADVVDMARLGDAYTTTLVLLAPATGTADTCLVLVEPWAIDRVIERSPAALGDTKENPLRAASLQQLGDYFVPFGEQYDNRSTAYVPLIAGAAVGLVAAMLMWIRRGRYALYSTLGLKYSQVVQLRLYEWAILLALGVLPGITIALASSLSFGFGQGFVSSDQATSSQVASRISDLAEPISVTYWVQSIAFNGLLVGCCAFLVIALFAPFKPATLAALKDR